MTLQMRRLTMLEMAARSLVPVGVGVAVTSPKAETDPLWPAEQDAIKSARQTRVQEFTAGRTAARKALLAIGRAPSAIPMGEDRAPVWPRAVVGSISHDMRACISIVGERERFRGLGVDIEPAQPLEGEIFAEVCRPEELAWLRQLPFEKRGLAARRFFSVKEAIYKAQYAVSREMFDFHALSVVFDRQGKFDARLMQSVNGFEQGQMFTGVSSLVGEHLLSVCHIEEEFGADGIFPNSAMG